MALETTRLEGPAAVEPFLKWAGGKRWLAASDLLPLPSTYSRYIEPFLGGGAVFFRLCPREAILSDLNSDLIDLYKIVRDSPKRLLAALEKQHVLHSHDHYYRVRASKPRSALDKAVRTLYLNRTCFNGSIE